MLTGCSKKEGLHFCEGVTTEGDGVNCGKVFTTGDLTAVIKTKEPFGTDSLTIVVREKDSQKKNEKKFTITVDREKASTNTTLQFYNQGKYSVEVLLNNSVIAGGEIEVRDTY